MSKIVHALVKEICQEKKIDLEVLSYNWILKLTKNGKNHFIIGNSFDLNTKTTAIILNDKYATYEVLKSIGVPVIEHKMLFLPDAKRYENEQGTFGEALQYFYEHHDNVVIKPNKWSEGKDIFHCTDSITLERRLFSLFQKNFSVSICPFYKIKTEYRSFYLDGKIEFIYGKVKPVLKGNGVSTVEELLMKFNQHFPEKKVFRENLAESDLRYVPAKDEEFEFSWKFNLSGGAQVDLEVSDFARENIENIIHKISDALNLRFVTIDIIQDENDEFRVMEINAAVCFSQFINLVPEGREIAKRIYAKAIDAIFK